MNKALRDRFDTARKRLRSASYWMAENKEPLHIIQEMNFNLMALRAEMTTIMDILGRGEKFEEDSYMEQMITRLNEMTNVMSVGASIMVDNFGLVVDLKKIRQDGKTN